MPTAVAPATSTDAYRRAARRLRGRLGHDPVRLQRSLKALADRPPATPAAAPNGPLPPSAFAAAPAGGAAQRFADHLAAHAPNGVLRYSQRLEFLRAAHRLGIGRFEANLLIAAVIDRRRPGANVDTSSLSSDRTLAGNVAAFAVVQGALLLGAWWTLFR